MYSLVLLLLALCSNVYSESDSPFKVSLTISAVENALEVSWSNLKTPNEGYILLTDDNPQVPFNKHIANNSEVTWTYGAYKKRPLYFTKPTKTQGWITTNVSFNDDYLRTLNVGTHCYGYFAVYVDNMSNVIFKTCIRAYATWMNKHMEALKRSRICNLFILGTHNSGSYKKTIGFLDTFVVKYSVTQNDDIRNQLMHGVRYLDIRPAYYSGSSDPFWVNHYFVPQNPLIEILRQVGNFVRKTNEIVVLGFKEFPHGFETMDIHHKLVKFVKAELGDVLVDAKLGWGITLEEIWESGRNVIFSYDYIPMVRNYPSTVFDSVKQRWANTQSLSDLRAHFVKARRSLFPRPYADMAELTAGTWDVIWNRWGGLRNVADQSNHKISKWYSDKWFMTANIVAVDFYRGTTLMETAIEANLERARK